jgi:hypothetical protein
MYPFLDTQLNTLLGLINQSNPGLQVAPLSAQNLQTLVPTAITPGSGTIQDTSVRLMTVQGNGRYIGNQTVTYRRINLSNLYRSMVLTLDTWIGSTTMTAAQFVSAFNAKYGTELVTTDFSNTSFTSGTQYTVSMLSTSLCYSGSITFTWTQGKEPVSTAITNPVLSGKLYPGGNSFPSGRKPQADFITYGFDFASISANLKSLSSSVVVTPALWATSPYSTILAYLQQQFASQNFSGSDSGTTGGLGNLTLTRYALPSASVPGANSAKFANVTTIAAVAGSWFQGLFYLHYN